MGWTIPTDGSGRPIIDAELSRRVEGIEIKAVTALDGIDHASLAKNDSSTYKQYGRATAYFAPSTGVLALNRIIGLGLWDAVDNDTIDDLLADVNTSEAPRYFVQVSPFAKPDGIVDMMLAKGLSFRNNWVKLIRHAEPLEEVACPFEVRQIDHQHAHEMGRICVTSFEWPDWMVDSLAKAVCHSPWRFYCAFDYEKPVATGGLYIDGDTAYISMAATLPEFRGRKAQRALAIRRINDAINLGCKLITVETAEETPERSAPSYRNMIRLGFSAAYRRPNYLWERS